jgi:predicted nuclease of restriction endonuclease-like (RecB) superfamily
MMSKKQPSETANAEQLYQRISNVLADARSRAYRAVNSVMVQAYWEIGRIIVEEEQQGRTTAEYGEYLIKELSSRLTKVFGKGFDRRNLWFMRSFYLSFEMANALRSQKTPVQICDASIPSPDHNAVRGELPVVRPELTWTHYRLLLKVERPEVRQFYIDECIAANWSTRQLDRQICSFYYERLLASRDREPVREEIRTLEPGPTPQDIIKDPFVLEFLGMQDVPGYLEKELEQGLIDKLHDFLLELGRGFAFVKRQQRISADGDHFYIDLVFYNYILKCFVLIDLKTGKLTHQDIGQMDFYIRWYEDNVRAEADNPTIGIILCSKKNETIAKYSVLKESQQIFASRYMLYLPTEKELQAELAREKQAIEMEKRLAGGSDELFQ